MLTKRQQHIVDVYGKPITTLDELAESCIAVVNEIAPVVGFAWSICFDPKVSCSHNSPQGELTNWSGNYDRPSHFPGFTGRFWIRYADDAENFDFSNDMNHTLTYTGTGGGGAYDGIWHNISSASYRTRKQVRDARRCHGYRYDYIYPAPKCYSTDYKIFKQDFPDLEIGLSEAYEAHEYEEDKQQTFAKVAGKWRQRKKFVFRHKFEWEDPAVKAADEAFLEQYKASLTEGEAPFSEKIGIHMPA